MALVDIDYKVLNRVLCKYGRKALAGAATLKSEKSDGGTKYVSLSSKQVLEKLRLADAKTEMTVARLRFYQGLLKDPQHHKQYFTALLSHFSFEKGKCDHRKGAQNHSFVKQWWIDLERISEVEEFSWVGVEIDDNLLNLVQTDWLREEFLKIDVSFLREHFHKSEKSPTNTHAVPPPGYTWAPGIPDDTEYVHICEEKNKNGGFCLAKFKTLRGLQQHKSLVHDPVTASFVSV